MPTTIKSGLVELPRAADDPVIWRTTGADGGQLRLEVFVGGAGTVDEAGTVDDQRLPVAGRYERDGELVVFRPTFGFAAGQHYVVRTGRADEPARLTEFRIAPTTAAPPAQVTAVYPSGDVLPENVLRFHVHFSTPMAPHVSSDFIGLRDSAGTADPAAFMRFKQELWNEDRTRLTLLIDPARIKRSVATKLGLRPALLEGRRFSLAVDAGWPSADGSSTAPRFSKDFRVGPPLRQRPGVERWTWASPRAGTHEPLAIRFDRPFDRHRLSEAIHLNSDGRRLEGTPSVGRDEMAWSFVPAEPWPEHAVRVTVDNRLEDIAGNNLEELLERDIGVRRRGPVAGPPARPTNKPKETR